MTHGELALFANEELKIGVDLEIVKIHGWRRQMYWDDAGLCWVNPAFSQISLDRALGYLCTAPFRLTNTPNGSGTVNKFMVVGAPWINAIRLTRELNSRSLGGVKFRSICYKPKYGTYCDELCEGTYIYVRDREKYKPVEVAVHIASTLKELYPDIFKMRGAGFDYYFGSEKIRTQIERSVSVTEILESWQEDLFVFSEKRENYLLYQ